MMIIHMHETKLFSMVHGDYKFTVAHRCGNGATLTYIKSEYEDYDNKTGEVTMHEVVELILHCEHCHVTTLVTPEG